MGKRRIVLGLALLGTGLVLLSSTLLMTGRAAEPELPAFREEEFPVEPTAAVAGGAESAPTPDPTPFILRHATAAPTLEPDAPPRLELLGEDPLVIPAGPVPFADPGCTAWDDLDGDLTQMVTTAVNVNPYHAGEGSVTYTVSDRGGQTTSVTRRVIVGAAEPPETVEPEEPVVYLTFDDGPSANTMRLLDLLDACGVKATFFLTGNSEYRHCIREIAARGHAIGIHSATHDYSYIYSGEEEFFQDFLTMQDIIFQETGLRTTILRFPGGGSNTVSCFNPGIMSTLARDLQDMGYQYFDWNVSAQDASAAASYRTSVLNVERHLTDYHCAVVLMHETQRFSVEAVPEIVRYAQARGYVFRPLDPTSPTAHHTIAN